MWKKLKSLLVMDAPAFWDQPLDEFMAEQAAKADEQSVPATPVEPEQPKDILPSSTPA